MRGESIVRFQITDGAGGGLTSFCYEIIIEEGGNC